MPDQAISLDLHDFSAYLKPRPHDWHKGNSGHVLIVGGDECHSGAPRMAAEAALRVGAGLVTVATHPQNTGLNLSCPEIMCRGIKLAVCLIPLIEKADVIVLGPGLGQSSWSKRLFKQIIQVKKALVIDADGLNLLAHTTRKRNDWVLTPHPAEAGRLLHSSTAEIQSNRLAAVKALQKRYDGNIVLKGSGSLVISNTGNIASCDAGNPGMASAGMGDILSGVIGGLIAQGIPADISAQLGVILHASAGDLAAKNGGERGLIATDLLPYLRQLVNP